MQRQNPAWFQWLSGNKPKDRGAEMFDVFDNQDIETDNHDLT